MSAIEIYTAPADLPPPADFILAEVEIEDEAYLQDLIERCLTIKEFKFWVLPYIARAKSGTGYIMYAAIQTWREGEIHHHQYQRHYHRNMTDDEYDNHHIWGLPWNKDHIIESRFNQPRGKVDFDNSGKFPAYFLRDMGAKTWNDGDGNPEHYISPSAKMRDASKKFQEEQVIKYVSTKKGTCPKSRAECATYHMLRDYKHGMKFGRPDLLPSLWILLDYWKKRRYRTRDGFMMLQLCLDDYNTDYNEN